MRLLIDIPAAWPRTTDPRTGDEAAIVPGPDATPDARIEWGPLILLPDEQRAWVDAAIRRDTPVGAQVQITSNTTGETTHGWPVRLVEATVHPSSGGPPTEWRTASFYAFFEHAAIAWVRTTDEARHRARLAELHALLLGATPDWSAEPACLAELWDVETRSDPQRRTERKTPLVAQHVASSALTDAVRRASLAVLDAEISAGATPDRYVARGELLRKLGDREAAIVAFRDALALSANHADAHYGLATVLAASGHEGDAIAEWEAAAAADPADADALFNAGMARYRLGDHAGALGAWQQALARSPHDFWITRKLVQAHHALGQLDEVAAVRASLIEIWKTSTDPAVRMQDEYVFDQFPVGDVVVHGFETLRPRDPTSFAVYSFRVVDPRHQAPPLQVAIETSDYAKSRGVPYVLSILDGTHYRALGSAEHMPPYPELKRSVAKLIEDALAARARGASSG